MKKIVYWMASVALTGVVSTAQAQTSSGDLCTPQRLSSVTAEISCSSDLGSLHEEVTLTRVNSIFWEANNQVIGELSGFPVEVTLKGKFDIATGLFEIGHTRLLVSGLKGPVTQQGASTNPHKRIAPGFPEALYLLAENIVGVDYIGCNIEYSAQF
ncbi:MAG: hypothetical protein KDD64_01690 [Bdellovibrionales bacterium]|nr:hypothetical protein [Bdellovibrionales bacterium]